ncbi:FGGY-family carbohydrate kinase [Tellurirhabdus bombi]|uniref:FGGY-family carbohydrate kinase n=1 Tax=Tellurirhabdus bombi TaxID=2907205 RepID=UPI001EFF4CA9|nr:FGGY family carbohydrate kinase [Tellurirhabdus bombi]
MKTPGRRAVVYAVFDVGKTNKKLILFDENRQVVEERQDFFPEIEDEDGFPCDDIDRLTRWVRSTWMDLRRDSQYIVKGVNFTAYGASFVHLDAEGRPVLPLYNYLKPIPEELSDRFYASLEEDPEAFAACTCSPRLGLLNSGLQLYWLKYAKPEQYKRIHTSLHLPQYLSYLITGEKFSDFTSVGCHTALWNFNRQTYHDWVFREGIDEKLAPLTKDSVASVVDGILVGVGLHDSSSAVVPYLLQSNEPFLLVSTGTWCINLNPFNNEPLTPELLRRDCLSYLSPKGQMTKASRVFFGREHDYQVERIAAHFNVSPDFYKSLVFTVSNSQNGSFRAAHMAGTGPFPEEPAGTWDLSGYGSAREAYHHLMHGLMDVLQASIELVQKGERTFYVDGGFARNPLFMQMLAQRFPGRKIRTLEVPQATALGALMHLEQGEARKQTHLLFT